MTQGKLHRHTGGLENKVLQAFSNTLIHRHTGGLEKYYRESSSK